MICPECDSEVAHKSDCAIDPGEPTDTQVDVVTLSRLTETLPGCGHWKDAIYQDSWALRLMDGDAEWRFVCEAIIDVASGQRYCMDEGPRVEPHEIEQWFRTVRLVADGQRIWVCDTPPPWHCSENEARATGHSDCGWRLVVPLPDKETTDEQI